LPVIDHTQTGHWSVHRALQRARTN